jgi:putative endonuclease
MRGRLCEVDRKTDYGHKYTTNQKKAVWAEFQVVKYYQSKKWVLVGHRKKLKFGEVDLIFKHENSLHFIEVKYLNNSWNIFERISPDQKKRLSKNRVFYSLLYQKFSIETWIALVSFKNPKDLGTSNLNLIHLEE